MPVSPEEILAEIDPTSLPQASPPDAAEYREADMHGISCAFCSKFSYTGEGEDSIPKGVCLQWEASVDGVHVCDRFASGLPTYDENGNEQWEFADKNKLVAEVHLSSDTATEDSGFVVKEILRTGEWPAIPTKNGLVKKPLRIVRDGKSDKDTGTIALAELKENFGKAISRVQIPLSDEDDDHKNITRVNTGFVRDLWIVDEDGQSKLVAKMEFTEPEVKDKVLRGTYDDVSCGIPWEVVSRGQNFGSALEHVAITNRPFIDGLGPFLAMSDQDKETVEVNHFAETPEQLADEETVSLSYERQRELVKEGLTSQLNLSASLYSVTDIEGSAAMVRHEIAETVWKVPFVIAEDEKISLSAITNWAIEEEGKDDAPGSEDSSETAPRGTPDVDGLEAAHRLREIRLSQPDSNRERSNMPLTQTELDRLELSDEQRAVFQKTLDENAVLMAKTREGDAVKRITELEGLGLKERPGALKFYREVFLADDGGPAVVLLSDDGKQEKERLTALEVLDRFIEGIKGSDDKVNLSDQHLTSGNDDKPPANAENEAERPLAERVAEAKQALGRA